MRTIGIIGHRGAGGEAPENTLSGFHYAKRLGLAAVEFDVRLARDGELVVIHDATVDRTTNARGAVAEFTAPQLAALDARAGFPDWPEPCGVPTLAEVLDVVGDLPTIQIEIKSDTPERLETVVGGVLRRIRDRALGPRVVIASFDPVALEIVQRLAPQQARAFVGAHDRPEFLEQAQRLGCVQADISLKAGSAAAVRSARAAGLRVVGWPCNTAQDLERAIAWGVGGVTSDRPSDLLPLLQPTRSSVS